MLSTMALETEHVERAGYSHDLFGRGADAADPSLAASEKVLSLSL
jgi:hypothetical protein